MRELRIQLPASDASYHGQLLYALHFCDERLEQFAIHDGELTARIADESAAEAVKGKILRLVERYADARAAFDAQEIWRVGSPTTPADVYPAMVEAGLVVPEGPGRAVLKGAAARLLEGLDRAFVERAAKALGCEAETYPATIACEHLAQTQHVTSFPQHLQFVFHLREDLDVIDAFTKRAKETGAWNDDLGESARRDAAPPGLALNPSVCYHCYLSLKDQDVSAHVSDVARKAGVEGHAATARTRCHRHEGGNMGTLRRLADFDMREVIFVGKPDWVKAKRNESEALVRGLLEEWDIAAALVTANDPFFTDDYEVKAPFQRRQEMKREVTVAMPDGRDMAICSSNFHSTAFGKAFNIRTGKFPACSGCFGWGLERWVYAVFLRHGRDTTMWPASLRELIG